MPRHAYIFDLMGTLVPLPKADVAKAALLRCAAILGVDDSAFLTAWAATFGVRNAGQWGKTSATFLSCLSAKYGWSPSADAIEAAAATRRDFAREALQPAAGTREVLARLRSDGHMLGLVSVCGPATVEAWPDSPLRELIDHHNLSAATGLVKPAAEAYLAVCNAARVAPEQALFVGDGAGDELRGATDAGLTAVLLESAASSAAGLAPSSWNGFRITSLAHLLTVEWAPANARSAAARNLKGVMM